MIVLAVLVLDVTLLAVGIYWAVGDWLDAAQRRRERLEGEWSRERTNPAP